MSPWLVFVIVGNVLSIVNAIAPDEICLSILPPYNVNVTILMDSFHYFSLLLTDIETPWQQVDLDNNNIPLVSIFY